MRRTIFRTAVTFSVLACWASIVTWQHSLYWTDVLTWTRWTTVDDSTATVKQVAAGFGHGRFRLDLEQ